MFIHGIKWQEAERCAMVGIWCDVNSHHDNNCELAREIKRSAGDFRGLFYCYYTTRCARKHRARPLCSYWSLCFDPAGVACVLLAQLPRQGSVGEATTLTKIMLQSRTKLIVAICSSNWSILCLMDLVLVRKRLRRAGRCSCLRSLASEPDRHPRFCFLSLCRLL